MNALAIVVLMSVPLAAAGWQGAPAAFDAASVKRNTSGDTRIRFETPAGRLNAINVSLRFLIRQAYRVPESRIIGGPAWLDGDRFDVVATAGSAAAGGGAVREMLQALLRERFALALRAETREMPAFVLRVARADGTLGPNLRRSSMDCSGRGSSVVAGQVRCGVLVSPGPASVSLRGGGATIENAVRLLADFVDRPVVDDTGLAGTFDFELQFGTGLTATATPDDAPAVSTALREQLGLRLDTERKRVDVWVVDAASMPSVD